MLFPATPPRAASRATSLAVERDALDRWWFDLGDRERAEAARLSPDDLLPESMAVRLLLYGVPVDTTALVRQHGGHRVVLHPQPAVLTDYLNGVRAHR